MELGAEPTPPQPDDSGTGAGSMCTKTLGGPNQPGGDAVERDVRYDVLRAAGPSCDAGGDTM
jgi:hypothetical protein